MTLTRQLTREDRADLARLHAEALPTSLITRAGAGFLPHFYDFCVRSPFERLFVERDKGRIIGAAVLSLRPQTLGRRLFFKTALPIFLLTNWPAAWAIARRLRIPPHPVEAAIFDWPEIVTIFVDPQVRSQGIGARLLRQAEVELRSLAYRHYRLRTEAHLASRTPSFYARQGFEEIARFDEAGLTIAAFKKILTMTPDV